LQVIPLIQILFQSGIGIIPRAKVVLLAMNLLGPAPCGMRKKIGKSGYGFFGFEDLVIKMGTPYKTGVISGVRHSFIAETNLSNVI